jgi:DDE superfamily endonuclease
VAALEPALDTPPTALGLPFDVWTSERLAAYRQQQQTGVRISPGWRRVLLAQHGGVCGRPTHTRKHPCRPQPRSPPPGPRWRRWGKKVRAEPERYELHYQDETHLATTPYLGRVWHRRGTQPTLPGVGTNRRVTVFGSVEALGRTRIELVRAAQDTAGFVRSLELLEAQRQAVQREILLVLDKGAAHTRQESLQALAARRDWLHVLWLAKYAPQLNPQEREWRRLTRDARSHLAADRRSVVDSILVGLQALGGACCTIVDELPQWFLEGHRQPPTGRRSGRPVGATDSYKRAPYRRKQNLPAAT